VLGGQNTDKFERMDRRSGITGGSSELNKMNLHQDGDAKVEVQGFTFHHSFATHQS
jgi:hypothetical protein